MSHPYASEAYVRSLGHAGEAFAVPEWRGHVLSRPIPHGGARDAMGPYPLAVISPDADLSGGLQRLADDGLVSIVLVLDDRLRPQTAVLEQAFDVVRSLKSHFLYDRTLGPLGLGKHHRYELRRALTSVEVREIALRDHLADWQDLYGTLAARHGLGGLHAFPPAHHATLARLPGVRTFGAFLKGRLVSAHVFVSHAGYAVSHLAASAPQGYETGAAYAVNNLAIAALTDCEAINFGGGAGLGEDPADGLVRFKKGFANTTAPAWLCGKVLNPAAYADLSAGRGDSAFFPAYRAGRGQA